jgi:hypothetical protein
MSKMDTKPFKLQITQHKIFLQISLLHHPLLAAMLSMAHDFLVVIAAIHVYQYALLRLALSPTADL